MEYHSPEVGTIVQSTWWVQWTLSIQLWERRREERTRKRRSGRRRLPMFSACQWSRHKRTCTQIYGGKVIEIMQVMGITVGMKGGVTILEWVQ